MHTKITSPTRFFIGIILILILACSCPAITLFGTPTSPAPPPQAPPTATLFSGEPNNLPAATGTPVILHMMTPPEAPVTGALIYDVESSGTAPELRAPYGDSYDRYLTEREFDQDMIYYKDLDIETFNVRIDGDWVIVSIGLIGTDPNNEIGIHYCVELDTTGDGFGEFIICAAPPYTAEWSTNRVRIIKDTNHDTGGVSAELSDAPLDGEKFDGYDKEIWANGAGEGGPDQAWVRINAGQRATVQIAFKTSVAGTSFLLGVLSDAGFKDVGLMYYNDRRTEPQAGSPVKSKKYYPLEEWYLFDNTCRAAINYQANGFEPMLCPRDEPQPKEKKTPEPPPKTEGVGSVVP